MDRQEKLKEIKEILRAEYIFRMDEKLQDELAEQLYLSMFEEKYELEDICAIVTEFELRADMQDSRIHAVFPSLLDLLECDRQSAVRLFNSFMESLELFTTFLKLVNEFDGYLTEEELNAVIERGCDLFGREYLAELGIIDDD